MALDNEFGLKDFSVRPGTIDFGRDYEVKISALLGLRCIRNKEISKMWLATNVNECGAFDDLVFYIETNNNKRVTYLIQLKHKMDPDDIGVAEFKTKKGNFSIEKYCQSIVDIKTAVDDQGKLDNGIINHLRNNQDNLVFILYTNRRVTSHNVLISVNRNTDTKIDWLLYNLIDTNGKIAKFQYDQFELKIKHENLFDNLFLFANQIHISKLDAIIENELNGIIKSLPLPKQTTAELVQNYLQFVNDWYKGKLGGFYPLTKNIISKVLLSNIIAPIMAIIPSPNHNDHSYSYLLWEKIIHEKWTTAVEVDDYVVEFLNCYISEIVDDYCKNEGNKNLWKRRNADLVSKQLFRVTNRSKEVKPNEAYELLWKTCKIPLLLSLETTEELNNIIKMLYIFPNIFKIILLIKSVPHLEKSDYLFTTLTNLDSNIAFDILNYPIKLQGRKSIKLLPFLTENEFHLITVKDIIYIVNNKFVIGKELAPLPDLFVDRTLETVWLKPGALELKNQKFIIKCDLKSDLKTFIARKKLNISCSEIAEWKEGVHLNSYRIIETKDNKTANKVFIENTQYCHFLFLFNGNNLQWVKSTGRIKSLLNFRNTNLDNFELKYKTTINNSCLNHTNLISAYPGMGKSWSLDYIFWNSPADTWILKVNLYDHVDYFKREDFQSIHLHHHMDYLLDTILCDVTNKKFVQTIFNRYLENKKVLLLFDGFDEVPICHHENVINMMKKIRNAKFVTILTTRPNWKAYLEESLDTFGMNITRFTKKNQAQYLTNFYASAFGETISENIHKFVNQLLNFSKRNLNDQDEEFTGIPLQTHLLAECFLNDFRYFNDTGQFRCEHFDLLSLYKHFIGEKIKIVCTKFGNTSEDMVHHYKKFRSLYAIQLLFSLEDLKDMNLKERIKQVIELFPDTLHQIQKDGIVVVENANKVTFVHRTFAEYLTAEWLADNINGENSVYAKTLILKIFDPSFVTVRSIFDRILAKDCPLHLAIINRQVEYAKTLCYDPAAVRKTDKCGRTVLHLIACWGVFHPFNLSVSREMEELYRMVAQDPAKKILQCLPKGDIVLVKDVLLGYTPIDYAIKSCSLNIAEDICASLEEFVDCITLTQIDINYFLYLKSFCYSSLACTLLKHAITSDLNDKVKLRVMDANENEIHHHIVKGNLSRVSLLLCIKENVNKKDNCGFSPLHISSIFSNSLLLQLLIANGADVNAKDNNGRTPLHWASTRNDVNIIKALLQRNCDINAIDDIGMSALYYAIIANNNNNKNEIISVLLNNKADISLQDNYNKTVLHYAIHYNQFDALRLLLNLGIQIGTELDSRNSFLEILSTKDSDGGTILHWAADKGFVDLVNICLSHGVDIEVVDQDCKTPMHWASDKGHTDVIDLLLLRGANIDSTDKNGKTPLHAAIDSSNVNVVELLLKRGASLHKSDCLGRTPLLQTIVKNNKSVTNAVLSKSSDLKQEDDQGMDALHLAVTNGDIDTVKLLLSRRVCLEGKNISGRTPLITACLLGYDILTDYLLSKGANMEARDNQDMTALHWASWNGHLNVVEILLERGVDLEVKDEYNRTALISAAVNGYTNVIELLLTNKANVEAKDTQEMTALNCAAQNNHYNAVDVLITIGCAKIDDTDVNNRTPLLNTVQNGHKDLVTFLLDKGAYAKHTDSIGASALHYAAFQGFVGIMELLITHGVDVDAKSNNGKTAIICSADAGSISAVTLLISKGASIEAKDNEGMTALSWAAYSGHTVIVNLLIALKGNIEVRNIEGRTPLLCAAQKGHLEVVRLLLAKKADLGAVDIDGIGSAQWAAYNGFADMLDFLLSIGVSVNVTDLEGRTLLMLAAFNNHISIVNYLLSKGVNINQQDNIGLTAMHVAVRNGHRETVQILLSKEADMEIKDTKGQTSLMRAAYFNIQGAAELLIEMSANVHTVDNNKCTILHCAALHGNAQLIQLVLSRDSELINKNDRQGKSALIHAAANGHGSVLKLLLEKESEIDNRDVEGNTALLWASHNGHDECVKVLLTYKANIDVMNNYGQTPLMCADANGHKSIVDQLVSAKV